VKLTKIEIMEAIKDPKWQEFRVETLKGCSTEDKIFWLKWWLWTHEGAELRKRKVQVQNYVNALKRGGLYG
jgi:hypothetical protein